MTSPKKSPHAAANTRIDVRVICFNGNSWTTGFNGTFEEAQAYFQGKSFTREDAAGREVVEEVHSVELIH